MHGRSYRDVDSGQQECKEAFLAYFFLLKADAPLDQETLDRQVEAWLLATFGVNVDFEVDDALGKLERLGRLKRDNGGMRVAPLDDRWDNIFQYANRAVGAPHRKRGLEPVS